MAAKVVCISRTLAAGGEEIGQAVAERLGFRVIDAEIIQRAAEKADVQPERVARTEHRQSLIRRLISSIAFAEPSGVLAPEYYAVYPEAALAVGQTLEVREHVVGRRSGRLGERGVGIVADHPADPRARHRLQDAEARQVERDEHASVERGAGHLRDASQHGLAAETPQARTLDLDECSDALPAGQCVQHLDQRGRVRVGEALPEARGLADRHLGERRPVQVVDHVGPPADALEVGVVQQHRHVVGGELHVELEVPHAEFDRRRERLQGVLGKLDRVTAVRDDFWQSIAGRHVRAESGACCAMAVGQTSPRRAVGLNPMGLRTARRSDRAR